MSQHVASVLEASWRPTALFFSTEDVFIACDFSILSLYIIQNYCIQKIHDSDFNLNDILSIILPGSGNAIESTD